MEGPVTLEAVASSEQQKGEAKVFPNPVMLGSRAPGIQGWEEQVQESILLCLPLVCVGGPWAASGGE